MKAQAKHTPGPWSYERGFIDAGNYPGDHYTTENDCLTISADDNEEDQIDVYGENQVANTKFITAACNSYDKHCGSRAVECAEGDMLGELLGTIRETIINLEDFCNPKGEFPWSETAGKEIVKDLEKSIAKCEGER